MLIINAALSLLMVLLTFIPVLRSPYWWVRVWDFPRIQLLVIGLLLALLARFSGLPVSWRNGLISGNLVCALYQAMWVYPYTFLARKQVKDARVGDTGQRIKVLVSNVLTPNCHAEKLIALVNREQPDIVVAVETDLWWQKQLAGLETDYPWVVRCPQDNLYGMHVYSRIRVRQPEIQYLVDAAIPSVHLLLEIEEGVEIALHCWHPMPPSPTENDRSTERDAELVMVGKSVANSSVPVIVTGDMNDVAWSRTTRLFLKLSGLMDPRRGRGMYATFHAHFPLLRWPLDHVFHSRHFLLGKLQRLSDIGSDHYPFLVELVYHLERGFDQQSLAKREEDEQRAEIIMAQVEVSPQQVHKPGQVS